jgi:putative glycosyl hydrolase-like family 15 (GHL15) protein
MLRRLILAAVSVSACALGASTCAGAALADTGPVGQLQVAIDSNAVTPNYAWNSAATSAAQATAAQEHVVILQAWETDELQAIKAANPSTVVLMYQNAASASNSASANGIYPTGVPYGQAASSGWLLDNTSGQPFTFEGENWLYAADIGSGGYQNAWASNVIAKLDSAPWDGVFLDDVNPTIAYHYCVTCVAKYPSDATYSAAMGSFVQNVGTQIRAAGKLAVANIGSWSSYASTVNPWLQYLSGAMDEEFVKWGTSAGTGYANEATWQTQLREVALAQSENKLFLGVTHSAASDEQAAVYGYATELLASNGGASYSLAQDYSTATWFPEYGYQLGQPTGSYTVSTNGVYERAFTGGIALVNPTGSTETVSLGGTYSGSGRTNVSSVTLAPQSAAVLTGNGATSGSGTGGSSGSGSSGSGSSGSGSSGSGSSGSGSSGSGSSGSGSSGSGSSGSGSSGSSHPTHTRHWWYERWLHNHHAESLARFLHEHLKTTTRRHPAARVRRHPTRTRVTRRTRSTHRSRSTRLA